METNIAAMPQKVAPAPLNGVNTPMLFATISAVGAQPKALILSIAILGIWLAAGTARTPVRPMAVTSFANTAGAVLQPGTRGSVIQL